MMGVGHVVGGAMTNDIVTDRCNNNIRRKCPDMVSRNNNDNSENNYYIMMPDNKLHEGEFIVKMVFLCLKL